MSLLDPEALNGRLLFAIPKKGLKVPSKYSQETFAHTIAQEDCMRSAWICWLVSAQQYHINRGSMLLSFSRRRHTL
jgi:hypothetical protein